MRAVASIPPPLVCRPDVYNTWKPFAAEAPLSEPHHGEGLKRFLYHVGLMCGHNSVQAAFILAWYAQMVQQPGIVPGTALVFKSKPGSGKGTLIRLIHKMLGADHSTTTAKVKDVLGQFN